MGQIYAKKYQIKQSISNKKSEITCQFKYVFERGISWIRIKKQQQNQKV